MAGVQRFDIDHLRDTIDTNLARRQAAIPDVERIIDGEAACYLYWLNERKVVPALVELRRRAEEMAGAELERTLRRIEHRTDYASGQDKLVEQEVAQLAHRIVAKLLHTPTVRLKEHAAHGNGDALRRGAGRAVCARRTRRAAPVYERKRPAWLNRHHSLPPLPRLRMGTRGSALARWQTDYVAARLQEAWPGLAIEITVLHTQGDRILDKPLPLIGGKGLFTAELEAALQRRGDRPGGAQPQGPAHRDARRGWRSGPFPQRAPVHDVLVSRSGRRLAELPPGAAVGTSSRRRAAQIRHRYPHLEMADIRGNVDTRVRKALDPDGPYDAIVLARAGIERLAHADVITEVLDLDVMLPAPGQGALAVQCRDDQLLRTLLAPIDHAATRAAVEAERGVPGRARRRLCRADCGAGGRRRRGRARHHAASAGARDGAGRVEPGRGCDPRRSGRRAGPGRAAGQAGLGRQGPQSCWRGSRHEAGCIGRHTGQCTKQCVRRCTSRFAGHFTAGMSSGMPPGPLAGKRVVVTQAVHQAPELGALLAGCRRDPALLSLYCDRAAGGHARSWTRRWRRQRRAAYDWIVITSANTVQVLASRLQRWDSRPNCAGRRTAGGDWRAHGGSGGAALWPQRRPPARRQQGGRAGCRR